MSVTYIAFSISAKFEKFELQVSSTENVLEKWTSSNVIISVKI
jgi:hypothetical protein